MIDHIETEQKNLSSISETISLTGISKSFSGIPALSDVNLDFYPGEVHAILGENGAGKSTLMNIIVGVLQPESGHIKFCKEPIHHMSPELASTLGISICYQHPAIMDDLSVLENLQVSLPKSYFYQQNLYKLGKNILEEFGLKLPLDERGENLTFSQKQLIEIAKALAVKPKLLILDEPTASLDQEATSMLFAHIQAAVKTGTSVIYITHRIAEVRTIANRVTVLRNGRISGNAIVSEVSNQTLLDMIIGRQIGSAFPAKHPPTEETLFSVSAFSGNKYTDVSLDVSRGEIVGIAGVSGNGQEELMRGLAGLEPSIGEIRLEKKLLTRSELRKLAAFIPSDRHAEGIISSLSIRENAALGALGNFSSFGRIKPDRELQFVGDAFSSLSVKASSVDAPILTLSGGNQQKVVMARALLSNPKIILADEPTQGVDVGARTEIYRILRENSESGITVIVNSSDAAELEGLCDKVIVMSRGRIVKTLTGDDIVESKIVSAAVEAETDFGKATNHTKKISSRKNLRHFLQTDNAPVIPLALTVLLLAFIGYNQNSHYLSSLNVSNILQLTTTLGLIAMGQTIVMMLGGIDLSVGPLAGFLVVCASFFINSGSSWLMITLGFSLILILAIIIGTINSLLIRFARFTSIAATLAMYIALQGVSFLLRGSPGGYINSNIINVISYQIGPIPLAFLAMCGLGIVSEYGLRKWRPGIELRAVGSSESSTQKIGLKINRISILGYIGCALFTAFGAITLMAQIGVGDPQQGVNYTLSSITAVVLGGTSLKGGRGTFIGTLFGALLLTEGLNTVSFLGLSQTWQYVFQGTLILFAALLYSSARRKNI